MPTKTFKVIVISESGFCDAMAQALENIIAREPRLIAILGNDCEKLEDLSDQICLGYGSNPQQIVTTSHPGESLEEVINFTKSFDQDQLGERYEILRL